MSKDVLVVGAGFAGAITAERLAAAGHRVLVIDRRDHIGGNAHDVVDEHGVLVHRYGAHIFHTHSQAVVDHLSRFTSWRPYVHRVLADVGGTLVPVPINRTTINRLYGLELDSDAATQAWLDARAEPVEHIRTSEDVVVAKVGRELYEAMFRGYTRKQWRRDPSELHASVCARIPVRVDEDDRYFSDPFQQMPADGFTAMFERILDHPRIEVRLGVDHADLEGAFAHTVFTGPIDAFFGSCFGPLPYRSLTFEWVNEPTPDGGCILPVAVVNEPGEHVAYTRRAEFRHLTGQADHPSSTIALEYPSDTGEPYYPVPSDATRALYRRYEALAAQRDDVTFVGRLARYQYLDMDQVVGQALAAARGLVARLA